MPYWYYRWIRPCPVLELDELRDFDNTQQTTCEGQEIDSIPSEEWHRKVQQLLRVWKVHQVIISIILG